MFFDILAMTIPFVLILATVLIEINRVRHGCKPRRALARQLVCFVCIIAVSLILPLAVSAAEDEPASEETEAVQNSGDISVGLGYIAAALVTSLAGIGGGIAVAAAAPAAIGATSEDPRAFGKALIFVALGEGIALYGLLVSILILNKL